MPKIYLNKQKFARAWYKYRLDGFIFILPWIIGMLAFQLGPMISSFVLAFTRYDIITPAKFIGIENFRKIFMEDSLFYKSLWNTVYFMVGSVPISIIVGILVAVLLNQKIKGITIYRVLYYLPSVTAGVAVAIVWRSIYDVRYGLINNLLDKIGIEGPSWLGDPKWVMPSLIIMAVWGIIGQRYVIFLAGLQGIPEELYEAAEIDGASSWNKFRSITLPMLTPTIFFSLITGIISCFPKHVYCLTNFYSSISNLSS
ncbi:MAG: carbohydrate ABC transporter permease [bacterium]